MIVGVSANRTLRLMGHSVSVMTMSWLLLAMGSLGLVPSGVMLAQNGHCIYNWGHDAIYWTEIKNNSRRCQWYGTILYLLSKLSNKCCFRFFVLSNKTTS